MKDLKPALTAALAAVGTLAGVISLRLTPRATITATLSRRK